MRKLSCLIISMVLSFPLMAHEPGGINSAKGQVDAAFDLVHTHIYRVGDNIVFQQVVSGTAGANTPKAFGVPLAAIGFPETFNYDGVTAGLKVNADLHDPLLCVSSVWDVASGDLSLPATWKMNE